MLLNAVHLAAQPGGVGDGYRAAARLNLSPGNPSGYSVTTVYGSNPLTDPCNNVSPPVSPVYDTRGIRELEVDGSGNLFIAAARETNSNDWLLVYDVDNGANTLLPPIAGGEFVADALQVPAPRTRQLPGP